jgi:hypothetical protein
VADLDLWTVQRWQRGAVPGWVPRGVLVLAWLVAIAVTVGSEGPCTAAEPAACGPEVGWAVGASLLLATPVLLVLTPALGCAVGLLAGVVEQWDRVPEGRIAFALHGLACAVVLAGMLVSRRRQAAAVREAGTRLAVPGPVPRSGPGRFLAAGALLLAAAGCLALWQHWSGNDRRHLDAAQRMDARVIADVEDGLAVRLRLPDRQDEVQLDVVGSYAPGQLVPVLVDRTGAEPWVVLAAELPDPTLPLSAGLALVLLAAVTTGAEVARRRVPTRLAAGAPAVTVLGLCRDDEVELWDTDGSGPFARVPIRVDADGEDYPQDGDLARFVAAWRGETVPEEAPVRLTAVGDLRQGGWVALIGDAAVLWPLGTVRLLSRADAPSADDEDPVRGRPIRAGSPGGLPVAYGPPMSSKLLGAAMLLGLVLGPLTAAWLAEDGYQALIALAIGGQVGLTGLARLRPGVRLEPDRLVVRDGWKVHDIPWASLYAARRDGDELHLAWRPREHTELGPLAAPSLGGTAAEAATVVGEAVMAQRARARAAGEPAGPATSRWSGAVLAAAMLYAGAALATLLLS